MKGEIPHNMEQKRIFIPHQLDIFNTIYFVNELFSYEEGFDYTIDFKTMNWVEPFSLLYLSFALSQFKQYHSIPNSNFENYQNGSANSYAAYMGFFKSFGIDNGNTPGELLSTSRYIPIKLLDSEILKQKAIENYEHAAETTEVLSQELTTVLTQAKDGNLFDLIQYSIREIIRNVIEHSQAKRFGFCAQYYPQKGRVELSLLDTGIGIKEGLKHNPYLELLDDRSALHYALLPGISGKVYKGVKISKHDVWQNSGFGLYMTSELCRDGGSFFICSNSHGLFLQDDKKFILPTSIIGTGLRLVLDISKTGVISKKLSEYRSKGQALASELKGANLTASKASSMISRKI